MPVHELGDAVHVLLEFPDQPTLADAARPGDAHQPRALVAAGGVELVLQQPELLVATDEGGLERIRPLMRRPVRPGSA